MWGGRGGCARVLRAALVTVAARCPAGAEVGSRMADPVDEITRYSASEPAADRPPSHTADARQPAGDLAAPGLVSGPDDDAARTTPRVVPVLAQSTGHDQFASQLGVSFPAATMPHLAPALPGAMSAPVYAERSAERSVAETAHSPRLARAGATILIVENEDSNRTLMEKILSFAGYHCVTACNGQEALDAFDRSLPDLVLTDIAMPVMDGYETAARMRARPGGAEIPIVAVTAHAMSGDREHVLQRGCDEYLAKPYRPRELLEMVERLLREVSK